MKRILFYASAVAVMFSSCSKDATEVATPSLEGKVQVFSASIDVKNNSTRMEYDGANYIWALGDAIGVTSLSNLTNGMPEIPSYNTAENTSVASFAVTDSDARHFGDWDKMGDALYFYFPYSSDGKLIKEQDDSVKAQLSIPATQRYAPNTFFKNTVPAIGYVEKYVLGESEVKMNVPVSMIELMVKGFGETDALTLKIQRPGGVGYYNLAGSQDVVIPTDGTMPVFVEPTTEPSDKITLSFGNQSEGFEYEGAKKVIFVVPADLELNNATIELSNGNDTQTLLLDFMCTKTVDGVNVNDPIGSYKTQPNKVFALVKGNYDFTFGMDGKFVIEDDEKFTAEEKFLGYAYMAQTQNNDGYPETATDMDHLGVDWGYMETLGADWNTIAWIKASTTPELDFTGYDKEWATQQYNALAAEINALGAQEPTPEQQFKLRLYKWYADNDGAIEPLAYNSIVGDDDEKPIVIKGLKVKGSGIIGISPYSLPGHTCSGAKLKNLKFVNCTVEGSSFLAADSNLASNFENVVLGVDPEGNANLVEYTGVNYAGALFAVARPNIAGLISEGGVVIEKLPTVVAVRAAADGVKGQIAGLFVASQPIAFDLTDYNVTSLAEPVFGVINNAGLVTVDTADAAPAAATAPYAGFVGRVQDGATASIIVDDTAYWNGTATPNDGVAPLTAEELAYVLINRENCDIQLTNDIDMQGKELLIPGNTSTITMSIDGTAMKDGEVVTDVYSISNLTAKNNVQSTTANFTTLFGTKAKLSNVELNTVKFFAAGKTSNVGLANKGTAKNVTVDGLTIDCANITKNSSVSFITIGGIFATTTPSDIDNVTVKNVTINNPENTTVGAVAGVLVLGEGQDNYTVGKINVSGFFTMQNGAHYLNKSKAVVVDNYAVKASAYDTENYRTPFGAIDVQNAVWANGKTQSLTVAEGSVYQKDATKGNRLAASYWFPADFLTKAQSVAVGDGISAKHTYVFTTTGNGGNQVYLNNVGFEYKIN